MKFLSTSLRLLLILTMLAPALAKSDKCHEKKEVVKYVQGGANAPGNGTKEHPFATLQVAQKDPSWDVLIVLSSKVPLTDGIILANRKLIGEENPTCITFSPTQPTLTTLGVTVVGNSVVENLYIKDTTGSAINYDKAENLTVKNVLISGFNKGNSISVAGIQGNSSSPGETIVEHTIIRNNNGTTGIGISDIPANVSRKLTVCNCTFSALTTTGITSIAANPTTSVRVIIRDSYFHDFNATNGTGVSCSTSIGAQETVLIKNSSFSSIASATGGSHIRANLTGSSDLKLKIDTCSFEENTLFDSSSTIFVGNAGSTGEVIVENSVSTNLVNFFVSTGSGASIQKNKLCGNTVTGTASVFYLLTNNGSSSPQSPVEITDIKGNLFTGREVINLPIVKPWTLLEIHAEHNCFTASSGISSAGFSAQPGNAGNADIFAHKNSFIGFTTDISDSGTNINYLVSKNFWGHTPAIPCTGGVCSSPYQVCKNNVCLGPIVTAPAPPFIGFIDASDPLEESIKCPKNFCNEDLCK